MKLLDKNEVKIEVCSDSDAGIKQEIFAEPSADLYLSFKKKKKKKKKKLNTTNDENYCVSGTQENESQNPLGMYKIEKQFNGDSSYSDSIFSDASSVKKKKKKRKISEIQENESLPSVIEDSFVSNSSSDLSYKKKHKKSKNQSLPSVIEDSFISNGSLKKKKHKNLEISESDSLPSVIEDSFLTVESSTKKKKKKKHKHSENDESQSTIDLGISFETKKNSTENSEIDDSFTSEIQPSLLTIDSDGSFIKKKKHKKSKIEEASFDVDEPSLLTIDEAGSFIVKKKHKKSKITQLNGSDSSLINDNSVNIMQNTESNDSQLLLNESDNTKKKKKKKRNSENGLEIETSTMSIESINSKKHKHSENGDKIDFDDSIIIKKKKKKYLDNDTTELIEADSSYFKENITNSHLDKRRKRKIKSEEEKPEKIKRPKKNEDDNSEIKPKKHKKKRIKEELLNDCFDENIESMDSESFTLKMESLSETSEVMDQLLTNDDEIKSEQLLSATQNSSKENPQVQQLENSDQNDDFQLTLAVIELSNEIEFHVPELHKIVNRVGKATLAQKALIKAKGLEVKQGKFTRDEDKIILENWEHFVKLAGIEDKPYLFFCQKNSRIPPLAKQNFLYYLSRNLPDRMPCSIFARFKLLKKDLKKGRFSREEDDYIKSMISGISSSNRPVLEMASHLKRTTSSIEHRIIKLSKEHKRKIKWRKNNAAAFIKYLLKATKCTEVEDLRNRPIIKAEWDYLSKKLDGVPVRILVRAWKERLHPALFIEGDMLDLRKVKIKLVKMFKKREEKEWKRVNWRRYASRFEGLTVARVYHLMKQIVVAHVPKEKRGNLKKCIKILSKIPEDSLRKHVMHKMVYDNGAVKEIGGKKK